MSALYRHVPAKPEAMELRTAVRAAWHQGHDTYAIALGLDIHEAVVCQIVADDQDRRRVARWRAEAGHA